MVKVKVHAVGFERVINAFKKAQEAVTEFGKAFNAACDRLAKNCKKEPGEDCKECFIKSTCLRVAEFIHEENKGE